LPSVCPTEPGIDAVELDVIPSVLVLPSNAEHQWRPVTGKLALRSGDDMVKSEKWTCSDADKFPFWTGNRVSDNRSNIQLG
jgi:hypothetical protein